MISVFLSMILVTSDSPYDWSMTCWDWLERSQKILVDYNIPIKARYELIYYLRTKVTESCPESSVLTKAT